MFARENIKICKNKLNKAPNSVFSLKQVIEVVYDTVSPTIKTKKLIVYIVDVGKNKGKHLILERGNTHYISKFEM